MAYTRGDALRKFLAQNGIDESELSQVALQVGNQGVRPVTGPQISAEEFLRGQEEGRYATGKPFQVDPSKQGYGALFDENTGKFRSGGYVRDESTGQTTTFLQPQRPRGVRTFGVDASVGVIKDMGAAPIDGDPIDYSYGDGGRQGVKKVIVPGLGEGVMGKDGFVYGRDNAGNPIWRAQAFSQQQEMANYDQDLKRQKMMAEIENTLASAAKSRGEYSQARVSEKAPTEDERKSAGYAIRMQNALEQMDRLGRDNPEAVKPQANAKMAGKLPLIGEMAENYLNTPARRQIEASQLDALDAALTLATGAAYTKEQLQNLSKSYFPQINDDEQSIKDKQARLASIVETARIRAGRAASTIAPAVNAQQVRLAGGGAPDANFNLVKEAQAAIAQGRDPAKVIQRLESMGVKNHGLR
jgi:hypothetical protein